MDNKEVIQTAENIRERIDVVCKKQFRSCVGVKELITKLRFSVCLTYSCATGCAAFPSCDFTVFLKNISEKILLPLLNLLMSPPLLFHFLILIEHLQNYPVQFELNKKHETFSALYFGT